MSLRCVSLIINIIALVLLFGLAMSVFSLCEKVRFNEYRTESRLRDLEQELFFLKEEL